MPALCRASRLTFEADCISAYHMRTDVMPKSTVLQLVLVVFLMVSCAATQASAVVQGQPSVGRTASSVNTNEKLAEEIKQPGLAGLGDKTVCLITGDVFVVEAQSASAQYQGKTYYFCCDGCAEDFLKNPSQYLNSAAAN
jgi:YHS domain-containing protein